MTLQYIQNLIDTGRLDKFYTHREWRRKKAEVLKNFKYECQICKKNKPGEVVRATVVHHVQFLSKHPELALSDYYDYNGKQYIQLLPLCRDCHEAIHERAKQMHEAKLKKQEKKNKYDDEKW